jgi:EAL domain-containing protein (putative c-di-GMP-specific phosphodiesterase class I)
MDMTRTREAILEADMQSALGNGQFELYYQPIVDIKKGEINQAEALIRWNHPELGQISPAEFIPLAERTKLIIPITDWAIKQACSQVVEWKTMGIQEIMISVNLSLVYFENRSNQLSEFIISTINEAGIKPSDLKLEITESSLMQDPENIIKVFSTLNHLGIRLALDDFGTGYSSFGYLKDLPVHVMKIDHSLIDAIDTDAREQMILQSLIMITHGLKLEVVAEGVETRGQYEFLKKYDCDNVQGYLFSRPLTNHKFAEYYFSMKEPGMVLSDFS